MARSLVSLPTLFSVLCKSIFIHVLSFVRPKNLRSDFKKPGPDGTGIFRAALISGPPGIGKTTAAHLIAELAGYNVIEMNASDTRSKKLLEVGAPNCHR